MNFEGTITHSKIPTDMMIALPCKHCFSLTSACVRPAMETSDQISTFFNIYRHKSPFLNHAQYTWSSSSYCSILHISPDIADQDSEDQGGQGHRTGDDQIQPQGGDDGRGDDRRGRVCRRLKGNATTHASFVPFGTSCVPSSARGSQTMIYLS